MAKAPKNAQTPPAQDWDEPDADAGEGFTQARDPEGDAAQDELEEDEAARRAELTNMQTTREREEGRDAVSGTLNPGVTQAQSDAHTQPGDRGSDMAGNAPKPDPMKALDPALVREIHDKLVQADKQDVANFRAPRDATEEKTEQQRVAHERSAGWRSLKDLGVHAITLKALVKAGKVEEGSAPGMQHHGDTGMRYRIVRDRG
jgi:hypothetical protein